MIFYYLNDRSVHSLSHNSTCGGVNVVEGETTWLFFSLGDETRFTGDIDGREHSLSHHSGRETVMGENTVYNTTQAERQ